jgi:hypothetical protein
LVKEGFSMKEGSSVMLELSVGSRRTADALSSVSSTSSTIRFEERVIAG